MSHKINTRVVSPPKDQQHVDRLGLLYFSRPHNDLPLNTIKSPLLEREGYTQNQFEKTGNEVPTMESESRVGLSFAVHVDSHFPEWTFAKQKWQRTTGYDTEEYRNATVLPGWKEKPYDSRPVEAA